MRWSQQPPRFCVPPSRQFGRTPWAPSSPPAAVAQLGFVRPQHVTMKTTTLALALLIFWAVITSAGPIRPLDSSSPVLQCFAPAQADPNAPGYTITFTKPNGDHVVLGFNSTKPLLTITFLHDLIVYPDGRVQIFLNEGDTKRMIQVIRRGFDLLFWKGSDDVIDVGKITAPPDNVAFIALTF